MLNHLQWNPKCSSRT